MITLGRNGHMENLLASDEILERAGSRFTRRIAAATDVSRARANGGYPIFDLREWKRDVGAYVRGVEQVMIDTLADYGIEAGRIPKLTGVWVGGAKIAAIGVHISRWVTSHGFALNVNTDLSYFQYIVPCGLTKPVTSMAQLGRARQVEEVGGSGWRAHFGRIFECRACCSRPRRSQPTKERTEMTDVVMPQMGESIVEGTLTKWLKKPGERVERDEPLFEISTDKVDTEIPSPAAGTLAEVLVEEGQTVGINTVVARIDEGGGGGGEARGRGSSAQAPPQPKRRAGNDPADRCGRSRSGSGAGAGGAAPEPAAPPAARSRRGSRAAGPLSPLVRKMARENNIDLAKVKGTGAGGRITKQDVEAYMAQPQAPARSGRSAAAAAASAAAAAAARGGPGPSRRTGATAPPAAGRRSQDARRADEHHAAEDRRAHGAFQAHLGACDDGAPRRYDEGREDARAAQGDVPGELRLLADLSAVRHARVGDRPAAVPAAQCVARREQHHLPQRHQYRDRGGAGERPDRARDPQCRREERPRACSGRSWIWRHGRGRGS